MKKLLVKKCLVMLGLYLFFTVIFPFPIFGNIMIAHAANIEEEQSNIKLNVKSKSLVKETSYALILYNIKDNHKVTYKSSESTIAAVDESGVVTAVDFGNATITVTVKDDSKTIATLQCEVTVGPPAISVKLTKNEVTLLVGARTSLTAITKPNNTVESAKFYSEDSTIATVSPGGSITAKSVGVTIIRAEISNGKYDTCTVTVLEKDIIKNTEQVTPTLTPTPIITK